VTRIGVERCYLVGVVIATPGMTSAQADLYGMEERIMQEYHGGPGTQTYTLSVKEVWKLHAPVFVRQCRMGADQPASRFNLGRSVSLPSDPTWDALRLTRVGTNTTGYVRDILQAWGQNPDDTVPIVLCVEPLAVLIGQGMWSAVMLRKKTKLPDKVIHPSWGASFPGVIEHPERAEIPNLSLGDIMRLGSEHLLVRLQTSPLDAQTDAEARGIALAMRKQQEMLEGRLATGKELGCLEIEHTHIP